MTLALQRREARPQQSEHANGTADEPIFLAESSRVQLADRAAPSVTVACMRCGP